MVKRHLNKIRKLLTRADLILIIILLSSAIYSLLSINKLVNDSEILIFHHNVMIKRIELADQEQIYNIAPGITLETKDNRIRLLSSTCKEQICVNQRWTRNLPIICVPNELMIIIKSKKSQGNKLIITS